MIEKQPHGLDRVELKKWRGEQLRGRCHEKSAAEWASLLNTNSKTIRSIANAMGEKCALPRRDETHLYWDEVDGINESNRSILWWARRPWGNYRKMGILEG